MPLLLFSCATGKGLEYGWRQAGIGQLGDVAVGISHAALKQPDELMVDVHQELPVDVTKEWDFKGLVKRNVIA